MGIAVIERPLESDNANPYEVNFEQVDRILDVIEAAMSSVAAKHQLRETSIQRWRWDQPEILMSWTPMRERPWVGKNLRALITPSGPETLNCAFESNAWFDDREPSGSFTRYWDHFPAEVLRHISLESAQWRDENTFLKALESAYEKVSDTKTVRLDHAIHIAPNGDAHEVNRSAIIGPDFVETTSSPLAR